MKNYNISFIYTFSLLSHILIINNFNDEINNSLYLSNIISLFGFCIMIYYYPNFFYNKYKNLLNTNLFIFNLLLTIIHIIPLYIFNYKNKINKDNIDITIIYTTIILLIYYLLFNSKLHDIYPFSHKELFILGGLILVATKLFYIF